MGCPATADVDPPVPASTPTEASARSDSTLRWSVAELVTIVPLDATRPDDLLVVDALFDSLTRWDEQLRPAPAAAVRWHSNGARQWRFQLREDATFHDGTPVRAQDFVASWSAQARDGAAHHHLRDVVGYADVRSGATDQLSGLTAPDAHTLVVRLRRPVADFPAVVAHPALGPVPAGASDIGGFAEAPIGNGPFEMAEPWARGRFVRLRRVAPAAADTQPRDDTRPITEVIFRQQDIATGYLAYEQGRVDIATVPPGALEASSATEAPLVPAGSVLRGRLPSTYLLGFDHTVAPFDDVAVRRAISLAIDRQQLISTVFEDNAAPGWSLVPSVVPGGRTRTCSSCRFSPSTARNLFQSAGVRRFDLWISEGGDHGAVAEQVRADLDDVGVDVRIREVPFDRFQRAIRDGRAGIFRFGWTVDYPTLESGLRPLFHSEAIASDLGVNVFGYRHAIVDRLLDRAAASPDEARRRRLFQRAEEVIIERDQAVVPLVTLRRRTAVADRVEGLTYSLMGTVDLTEATVSDPRS